MESGTRGDHRQRVSMSMLGEIQGRHAYLFNKLETHFPFNVNKVSCTAWTGIAATLLSDGRTVHSLFKLPVPVLEAGICNVSPTTDHAVMLKNQVDFITDEVSMITIHALHAIDQCLQDITRVQFPFGNKVKVPGGDFRQVLSVIPQVPLAVVIGI